MERIAWLFCLFLLSCHQDQFLVIRVNLDPNAKELSVFLQVGTELLSDESSVRIPEARNGDEFDFAIRVPDEIAQRDLVLSVAARDGAGCILSTGQARIAGQGAVNEFASHSIRLSKVAQTNPCTGGALAVLDPQVQQVDTLVGGALMLSGWGFRKETQVIVDEIGPLTVTWNSPLSLTAGLPPRPARPGALPVRVANPDGPTVTLDRLVRYFLDSPLSFEEKKMQTLIESTLVGDFDGDGLIDVAAYNNTNIQIWRNGNYRSWVAQPKLVFGGGLPKLREWRVGDVNRDGRADIIGYRLGTDEVYVLLGMPDCSLAAAAIYHIGQIFAGPYSAMERRIMLSDFDGDGKLDLLLQPQPRASKSFFVSLNDGSGGFGSATATSGPNGALRDIVSTADGSMEVLLLGPALSRHLRNGNFSTVPYWGDPMAGIAAFARSDVNLDGRMDVAFSENVAFEVHLSSGHDEFIVPDYQYNDDIKAVDDVDGDHVPDILGSNAIWINKISGVFQSQSPQSYYGSVDHVVDFDRDGRPDLLIRRQAQATTTIYDAFVLFNVSN